MVYEAEKPVPVTLKMVLPTVVPVIGIVKLPVCPPVPLAVKVPVDVAPAQLKLKVEAHKSEPP